MTTIKSLKSLRDVGRTPAAKGRLPPRQWAKKQGDYRRNDGNTQVWKSPRWRLCGGWGERRATLLTTDGKMSRLEK